MGMTSSIQVSEIIERNYVRRYLPTDQGGQLVIPFQSDEELQALQAYLAMRSKDHSIAVDDVREMRLPLLEKALQRISDKAAEARAGDLSSYEAVDEIELIAGAVLTATGSQSIEGERLEAEIHRLTDALAFAHEAGFEWPVDPLPIGSIAWRLRIERGNERETERSGPQ